MQIAVECSLCFLHFSSNFRAEPGLMPKTPSQRRRPRKRQSSALKDENEPTRRRWVSLALLRVAFNGEMKF